MDSIVTYVCLFGIICAIFTMILNVNLVFRVVLNKAKRVDEMILFYYRFVIDIFYGFTLFIYILYVLVEINWPQYNINHRYLTVYLALPCTNVSAGRSIISLAIAAERVFATYFPMKYRLIKANFPNLTILILSIAFGLSEWPVLMVICNYQVAIPPGCRLFGCSINKCFYNFWTGHKIIIFSIILVLTIILSVKLFIWNREKKDQKLSRANRLALLDAATVFIFDFLPSFCGNLWPTFPLFNFNYVGPYNGVGKGIGCAIESTVVSSVLLKSRNKVAVGGKTSVKNSDYTKTRTMS